MVLLFFLEARIHIQKLMSKAQKQFCHIGTSNSKSVYWKQKEPVLLGESYADWSGDQNDRKSNTDFYFKNGQHSGAISRQVRLEQTVAFSSCEAEYQSLAAAAQVLFFRQLFVIRSIHKSSQHLLMKIIKVLINFQLTLYFTSDQNT